MKENSLIKLAQKAGFNNLHSLPGLTNWLIGSIMSDDYEVFYFRQNNDMKTIPIDQNSERVIEPGTVDVFAIKDPYEHETCALYRLNRKELDEKISNKLKEPLNSAVGIDKRNPLYKGREAVGVLDGLAKSRE